MDAQTTQTAQALPVTTAFEFPGWEVQRSLGTWNVLCLIDEAVRRGLPYVYLGYYVEGCPSMSYKIRFVPNEIRGADGVWRDFTP